MTEVDQKFQKRQVAYKIRIVDIINSRYIKTEGFIPNYLQVGSKEISRINIVGVVVEKPEIDNYRSLIIDDGTGRISARIFENNVLPDTADIGDVVMIVGRPREFSSEKYLLIETIKKMNSLWAKVRNLELQKDTEPDVETKNGDNNTSNKVIEVIDPTPSNKILQLIKELDKGDGVSIEDISSDDVQDKDAIVDTLLREGDIFEIKPGRLKVLE